MKRMLMVLMAVTITGTTLAAQTAADSAAIRATALDYAEGWYEGNAGRMERAVHPELAKRIVRTRRGGAGSSLDHMTAAALVEATGAGSGSNTPAARQLKDVRILDIFRGTASVRTEMDGWVDYMHMARWNGEWRIVNVLWELKPRS